jgi:hypothetical protein
MRSIIRNPRKTVLLATSPSYLLFEYYRADKNASQHQYDTTITDVNQRISDKAVLQINLNETRDTVRETNEHVSYHRLFNTYSKCFLLS